jgi:hypothetical protein
MRRLWCIAAVLAAGGSACEVIAGIRDLHLAPPGGDVPPDDAQTPESALADESPAPAPDDAQDTGVVEASGLPDDTSSDAGDVGLTDSNGTRLDASVEDATFDSGLRDALAEGSPCVGDLSNIGAGDFRISFSLTSSQRGTVAVANQRTTCWFGMFWDVRLLNGTLEIETDDGVNYMQFTTSGHLVNDGQPHQVLIRRTSQMVTVQIDGVAAGTGVSRASFGRLSPVVWGMDPCQVGPMKDSTVAFKGTLTNLCVTVP